MVSSSHTSQRLKLQSALIMVVIFAAGIAAGFGLSSLLGVAPSRGPHRDMGLAPRSLDPLGLTLEQKRKAKEIGERHRDEIESLRREVEPRIRGIHAKMRKELEAYLTPEQREMMDIPDARRHKAPRDSTHGGPGGPTPPPKALDACSGKSSSDPCRFDAPHGQENGICRHVPNPDSALACVPARTPGF